MLQFFRMRLFCLQLETSCLYSGAFLLTIDRFSLFLTVGALLLTAFSFFAYSWSFLACSGKVRLIRALRDSKQRSLTVSKTPPTASEKASHESFMAFLSALIEESSRSCSKGRWRMRSPSCQSSRAPRSRILMNSSRKT